MTISNTRTPEILTLSSTFYDLSDSRNLFSKAEMRQFGATGTEGLKKHRTLLEGDYKAKRFLDKQHNSGGLIGPL